MEEKIMKQIKTSCPFPLLIYKTSVKYNEVRKASGIAYILLDLIQKSALSTERISDVLLKFGIPSDLHYIYGKEIAGLIDTEILQSAYPSTHFLNPKYFREIAIKDVWLTDKGKKMFLEGAIPTGAERTKVKDIYFSPVTRKFDVECNVPYMSLADCFLGEKFIKTVEVDISGLEDYLNANTTKIGLKAEERIVSFDEGVPEAKVTRKEEGTIINITKNGAEFKFQTSDEQTFFNKYYSSDLMTEMMSLKNNYKFVNALKEVIKVPRVFLDEVKGCSSLFLPSDIEKQAKRPCKIFLNKGTLGLTREDSAICLDSKMSTIFLDLLDDKSEFALVDKDGLRYYCPLCVEMPCLNFSGNFSIHLLVEKMATYTQYSEILQAIFETYNKKPFDSESGKVVLLVADTLKDITYFETYTATKLSEVESVDEKIALLMKLHSTFNKNADWKQVFAKVGTELLDSSMSEVRLDNMIYKKTVLDPLKENLGISNIEYITRFAKEVVLTEDAALVYQALETAEFPTEEILGVVNVVEKYMQAVLNNSTIADDNVLAGKYNVLQTNLWKLNDMLGVASYDHYTIKEDYITNDFFDVYSTLLSSYRSLEKYKQYAVREYGELKQYFDIYEPIHELLSMERTSASHPEKLTKKYIDDHISRGRYKDAICDLLVKLQFDLRNILKNEKASADELINIARDKKLVDRKQADSLHQLRMCRNGFQHPERRQIPYNKQTIEEWRDIVFMISEEGK